ncbi:hypothetical protein GF318_00275 [Candidatus Micrarchaeota archaeon]|nr:hypothetical protein [Candidatus Micrarchaeota archaeon]
MQSETEKALREILGEGFDGLNENLRAGMLGCRPETIGKSHEKLIELGLKPEKIASQAHLPGRDPETIRRKYQFPRRFFSKETICSFPQLLGNAGETVQSPVQLLHDLGIDYDKYPYAYTTQKCKRKKIAALARARLGSDRELSEKAKEIIRKGQTSFQ